MIRLDSIVAVTLTLLALALPSRAAERRGFGLQVAVGGCAAPEYRKDDTIYIEAVRGKDYTLRITNPLPCRVAVALSVDGLNTIDAKHTTPQRASKWVLDPYESIEIGGWQVNGSQARKFFFTGEKHSYGAWLGQTENLGVIEAVFYREAIPEPPPVPILGRSSPRAEARGKEQPDGRPSPEACPPPSSGTSREKASAQASAGLSDEFAATGIGDKVDHRVVGVRLRLEREPAATLRIRYEFRPQLVALGILPSSPYHPCPADRRERAQGFRGGYCPDPFDR
ncbi:MAG: hypothetical protein WBS54_07955 [Acidobacteriota bacterium]